MKRNVVFLIVVLTASVACANTGVFEGSGHTIKLIRSEDIQLQSERVTIVPGRGPFLYDGTGPGMDRVEYTCKFVLRNRSKKQVTIQVGFPLTSESIDKTGNPKPDEVTALVLEYKFIVRDDDRTYHVRFSSQDTEKKFGAIFLWDMTFQPDEVRTLNVGYQIPMATGLADTKKERHFEKEKQGKEWYSKLEEAIGEVLFYVTETGQSWAGPIEDADFEIHVREFERYLANRGVFESTPRTANQDDKTEKPDDSGLTKNCLIHRRIWPNGWKEKDGILTWHFKNYRPKEPIGVNYTLTYLPKTSENMPSIVRYVLGEKPSREDVDDLREIFMASWGIAPKSKSVQQFVSNQIWYSPKKDMTVDKLSTEQKAAIAALERCATAKIGK
jgi:hypothetical protein